MGDLQSRRQTDMGWRGRGVRRTRGDREGREGIQGYSRQADRSAATTTYRKGEITRADLKGNWPHHVALSADKVRSLKKQLNCARLCGPVGRALTYSRRRGDLGLVVFCFAKPEEAEAFCELFSGERLAQKGTRA